MGSIDFVREAVSCEREYHALCERLGPLITLQKFISMKNPSWSEDEVTYWTNIVEGNRARELDGGKHKETLHPLGAHNFAIVARCLGNQIIGVGVMVRSISLRCTMTTMMRIWSSLMMIVTLAQRLVIVTLAQHDSST
jgi:hypothetical protein